mmetsp:Transcript_32278/g.54517  ORF Transcript_32278/g.54517 Transcript_32278/m.54517 type:complete len:108 (+) Transcript_32278:751-1074(+)
MRAEEIIKMNTTADCISEWGERVIRHTKRATASDWQPLNAKIVKQLLPRKEASNTTGNTTVHLTITEKGTEHECVEKEKKRGRKRKWAEKCKIKRNQRGGRSAVEED